MPRSRNDRQSHRLPRFLGRPRDCGEHYACEPGIPSGYLLIHSSATFDFAHTVAVVLDVADLLDHACGAGVLGCDKLHPQLVACAASLAQTTRARVSNVGNTIGMRTLTMAAGGSG